MRMDINKTWPGENLKSCDKKIITKLFAYLWMIIKNENTVLIVRY